MRLFTGCKSSSMSRLISGVLVHAVNPRLSHGLIPLEVGLGKSDPSRNWKDSQSFGFARKDILPGNSQEWRLTGLPPHVVMIFIDFRWKEIVDSDLTSDLGSYIAPSTVGLHFHISDQSMSIHFTEPELRPFSRVLRVFFLHEFAWGGMPQKPDFLNHFEPILPSKAVLGHIFCWHFGPIKRQCSSSDCIDI